MNSRKPSGVWAGRRTVKGKRSIETGPEKPVVVHGPFKPAKMILDPVPRFSIQARGIEPAASGGRTDDRT